MATPCDVRYRKNPKTRYAIWSKVSPSAPSATAQAASSSAMRVGLDSRLAAGGTISAAQKKPTPENAARTM